MFYPLKFKPIYKDYLWGGRNLLKFGKVLPEGIVAESWEVSCHPNGESVISNGPFKNMALSDYIDRFGYLAMGTDISWKLGDRFPILVKLIDANDKLSVQVHPDTEYASRHEEDRSGKNEMWYILKAKSGAKLIYGLKEGVTKEIFEEAVEKDKIENLLNYIEVTEGDVINIPTGTIHAIGEGIILAEVQQNSDNTYRIHDYDRIDMNGRKRPLHIQKAMDVINFTFDTDCGKSRGVVIKEKNNLKVTKLIENRYFSTELYEINGEVQEKADGKKFFIYLFIEGKAMLSYRTNSNESINNESINRCNEGENNEGNDEDNNKNKKEYFNRIISVQGGESIFIPAIMGEYKFFGKVKALKIHV